MLFVLLSIGFAVFSGYAGLNQSSIESLISTNHAFASLTYTALFILLTTFSFSVSLLTTVGAVFFSGPEIIIYAMIGIMGSSVIDFYISRKLGRDYVREFIKKRGGALEKFDEIVEKNTFKTLLILHAIFFVPPIIPNLLGGVIKVNLKKFCITTFFGNLPNTVCTVYLIQGFLYSNILSVVLSMTGLILTTGIALYFYTGEIKEILRLSFPWAFRRK